MAHQCQQTMLVAKTSDVIYSYKDNKDSTTGKEITFTKLFGFSVVQLMVLTTNRYRNGKYDSATAPSVTGKFFA